MNIAMEHGPAVHQYVIKISQFKIQQKNTGCVKITSQQTHPYSFFVTNLPVIKAAAEVSKVGNLQEVGCCESWMAERSHRRIEKWLEDVRGSAV